MKAVQKWEYATSFCREQTDPVHILDERGAEGWELVSCYPFGEYVRFVYKRPIEKETEE